MFIDQNLIYIKSCFGGLISVKFKKEPCNRDNKNGPDQKCKINCHSLSRQCESFTHVVGGGLIYSIFAFYHQSIPTSCVDAISKTQVNIVVLLSKVSQRCSWRLEQVNRSWYLPDFFGVLPKITLIQVVKTCYIIQFYVLFIHCRQSFPKVTLDSTLFDHKSYYITMAKHWLTWCWQNMRYERICIWTEEIAQSLFTYPSKSQQWAKSWEQTIFFWIMENVFLRKNRKAWLISFKKIAKLEESLLKPLPWSFKLMIWRRKDALSGILNLIRNPVDFDYWYYWKR